MGHFVVVMVALFTVVLAVLMAGLFLLDVFIALLNALILYALLYRAYFDLRKGRWKPYMTGLGIGVLLALLLPSLSPLWPVTLVVVITFVVVETMRLTRNIK